MISVYSGNLLVRQPDGSDATLDEVSVMARLRSAFIASGITDEWLPRQLILRLREGILRSNESDVRPTWQEVERMLHDILTATGYGDVAVNLDEGHPCEDDGARRRAEIDELRHRPTRYISSEEWYSIVFRYLPAEVWEAPFVNELKLLPVSDIFPLVRVQCDLSRCSCGRLAELHDMFKLCVRILRVMSDHLALNWPDIVPHGAKSRIVTTGFEVFVQSSGVTRRQCRNQLASLIGGIDGAVELEIIENKRK